MILGLMILVRYELNLDGMGTSVFFGIGFRVWILLNLAHGNDRGTVRLGTFQMLAKVGSAPCGEMSNPSMARSFDPWGAIHIPVIIILGICIHVLARRRAPCIFAGRRLHLACGHISAPMSARGDVP